MTQPIKALLRPSRLALGAAVLAVLAAIGWSASRHDAPAPPAGEPAISGSAADPGLAALEQAAAKAPNSAGAWQQLGFARFTATDYAGAAQAYARAVELAPRSAVLWSALGEARVMASKRDPMPAEARQAFRKAHALDAKDARSRYFLAVDRDLSRDHEGAIAEWLALLRDTPADAPWREDLIRTIEQVGKINRIDVASRLAAAKAAPPALAAAASDPHASLPVAAQGIPGPSNADLAAAARLSPGQQREMADGMVASLKARLKADPGNLDGWIMLMRSHMALDQNADAKQAFHDAIAANPRSRDYLRQQASVLGIR